jgi:glutathione S-transferase
MDYIEVEEARERSGLRLVLSAGVPGPWSEAAKAVLHVKGLDYTAVRQRGGEANEALAAWTGQTSAPVAVWNDEPPCTTSRGILWLAERLAPEPRLVPKDAEERALCLGICDEIHGENGLGWCRRLLMFHPILSAVPVGDPGRVAVQRMADKYGYSAAAATACTERAVEILRSLDARLARQRAGGREFLVGNALSAADLYWATFAALIDPLPPELCPMPDFLRGMYFVPDGPVREALPPALVAHRDRIYRDHLALPLDF